MGHSVFNCASNIVTNFYRKLQYFLQKLLLNFSVFPSEKDETQDNLHHG